MGQSELDKLYEGVRFTHTLRWTPAGWVWSINKSMFASEFILTPKLKDIELVVIHGRGGIDLVPGQELEIDSLPFIVATYSPYADVYTLLPDTVAGNRRYMRYLREGARLDMGWAAIKLHRNMYLTSQTFKALLESGEYNKREPAQQSDYAVYQGA